jgi:hypothetical protein
MLSGKLGKRDLPWSNQWTAPITPKHGKITT